VRVRWFDVFPPSRDDTVGGGSTRWRARRATRGAPLLADRSTVPITIRAAEACKPELGDAQGGEMVLVATQPRDSIVANTWAALVLVCDYRGRIVLRAMRGSVFARAVRQSLLDMQLYGMSAADAQVAAVDAFNRVQQPPRASGKDAEKLFQWARGYETALGARMHADAAAGGLCPFPFRKSSLLHAASRRCVLLCVCASPPSMVCSVGGIECACSWLCVVWSALSRLPVVRPVQCVCAWVRVGYGRGSRGGCPVGGLP
jgi:hypothetical protein